ncbi:hypothetical protein Mapa_012613 [Marchantia paleacea]|nr:hypothetical protein Mapa_012613 [Marchantia paleacea]
MIVASVPAGCVEFPVTSDAATRGSLNGNPAARHSTAPRKFQRSGGRGRAAVDLMVGHCFDFLIDAASSRCEHSLDYFWCLQRKHPKVQRWRLGLAAVEGRPRDLYRVGLAVLLGCDMMPCPRRS